MASFEEYIGDSRPEIKVSQPDDLVSEIRECGRKKTKSKAETDEALALIAASVSYCQKTGVFVWKRRPRSHFATHNAWAVWNAQYPRKRAFNTKTPKGYLVGAFSNQNYLAHRVAWAVVHGDWPSDGIDHINGDKADNRIGNLRPATQAENMQNRISARISGEKPGVSHKKGRWRSEITFDRKRYFLGSFDTKQEAVAARSAAERLLGFWAENENGGAL